jgi:hypothetical protein
MSFKIPSIEELALSAHRDLIENETRLKYLESSPVWNTYPIQIEYWEEANILKRDINMLREALIKFKCTIREEKLKELGISHHSEC